MKGESGRPGELLFETYLAEQGYAWACPPQIEGIDTRPDYLIHVDGHTVLCEVKSFDVAGPFASGQSGGVAVGARSTKDVLRPHREDLKEAARQLKPWRGQGWPLVVVLSNPRGCLVPTDPAWVISAMYGDRELVAPRREDGSVGDFTVGAGRDGELGRNHQYLSAVVMLHSRARAIAWSTQWIKKHRTDHSGMRDLAAAALAAARTEAPEGYDVFVDVFETASDIAVPLPRTLFNGPRDRHFTPDANRTTIIQLPRAGTLNG